MKHSSPNRWIYGGILQRIEWIAGPCDLRCWDKQSRRVDTGDVVIALRTPVALTPVLVERRAVEVVA